MKLLFPVLTCVSALLTSCFSEKEVKQSSSQNTSETSPQTRPWAHEESDLNLDQKAKIGSFDNGFRYIIYPNAKPEKSVSLRLHINAGSLKEKADEQGIAHFLEHMVFEGSDNYSPSELIPEMQRLGIAFGAHANAYTSFDETVYMLDLPNLNEDTLKLAFTVMRDFCDGALLKAEEIEAERGVILSEKNSRDSVDSRLMKKQFEYLLPDSLISERFPIGTEECIQNTTREQFVHFYQNYYSPQNMTFVIVGDIDVPTFENYVNENFASLENPETFRKDPDLGKITQTKEFRTAIFSDPEVDSDDLTLQVVREYESLPDTLENRIQRFPISIASSIVSRRLEKISKEENSPINAGAAYTTDWFDMIEFGGIYVTPSEGKWKEAVSVVEQEFRKALQYGFTESEFEQVKANLLNSYKQAAEKAETRQSRGIATSIVQTLNERAVFTTPQQNYEVAQKAFKTLTIKDCHQAFQTFWNANEQSLILTTAQENEGDQETLKQLYLESQKVAIEAPVNETKQEFAYQDFGPAGTIISETRNDELDLTQLTLSNNVRVNLKKTDFQKETIHTLLSFGNGLISLPEDKGGLQGLATAALINGGLGKHSHEELQRIIAGETVGVTFAVGPNQFTLSGVTNQEDFLLQNQLICAYLTDFALRAEAIRPYKKALPDQYDSLKHTLGGAFTKMSSWVRGEDHRFRIVPEEQNLAYTADDARAWVSPFFESGYAELTIVGDFDEAEVKSALLKTVGALPKRNVEPAPYSTTLTLQGTPSAQTFTYESKLERAAAVTSWQLPGLEKNITEMRRLNILANILDDRMRTAIREKLGASYSPYANTRMDDAFSNFGLLNAVSVAKPDDLAKINEILLQLGADLADTGATKDELDRALNPVLESLNKTTQQNAYWLGTVMNLSQRQPEKITWAENRDSDYRSITLEEINALAKKYLQKENAYSFQMKPKQ